jgi:hypothetical protein
MTYLSFCELRQLIEPKLSGLAAARLEHFAESFVVLGLKSWQVVIASFAKY